MPPSASAHKQTVRQAMVLAAGRGARFRPVTDRIPKPLVAIGGKPLIDWQLEMLAAQNIERVVVNCCYLGDMLREYISKRDWGMEIAFSMEESALETGGGIKRALPFFGGEPFFAVNSDVVIWPQPTNMLASLERAIQLKPELALVLLLQARPGAIGIRSAGDFFCNEYGHIWRRGMHQEAPYIFTGVQLVHPAVFDGIDETIFSMNVIYDRLMKEQRDHIAGIVNTSGMMLHVGDPEGHQASEHFLRQEQHPKEQAAI